MWYSSFLIILELNPFYFKNYDIPALLNKYAVWVIRLIYVYFTITFNQCEIWINVYFRIIFNTDCNLGFYTRSIFNTVETAKNLESKMINSYMRYDELYGDFKHIMFKFVFKPMHLQHKLSGIDANLISFESVGEGFSKKVHKH